MNRWKEIIRLLTAAKRVLIGSHYNPDGDAIGSSLALAHVLDGQGKAVTVYNRDSVPANLRFLPGSERIVRALPSGFRADAVVVVDVADPERVGPDFQKAVQGHDNVICIDHHLIDDALPFKASVIDANAAATGVLIAELLKKMKIRFEAAVASHLYCALVVDTGFFRYSNTTDDVLLLAVELLRAGAKPEIIALHLEESSPPERLKLLAQSLLTLEVYPELHYASIDITQQMLADTKAQLEFAEEFSSFPRSIQGIDIAAVFKEIEANKIKVSLRSKGAYDVSAIAKKYQGGGHMHAAGCTFSSPLSGAKATLHREIAALNVGRVTK